MSQSLPNVLGTGQSSSSGSISASNDASATHVRRHPAKANGEISDDGESVVPASGDRVAPKGDVRRQQSAAERALSGFASALGGGGPNSPSHAGSYYEVAIKLMHTNFRSSSYSW